MTFLLAVPDQAESAPPPFSLQPQLARRFSAPLARRFDEGLWEMAVGSCRSGCPPHHPGARLRRAPVSPGMGWLDSRAAILRSAGGRFAKLLRASSVGPAH